jgi:hypothetical protein
VDSPYDDTAYVSGDRLNYFNYFTEVEEEFVRRRGKPLLISPMDWALIESWKTAGIPLHVVLRAISQAFDSFEAHANRFRKVNSVLYCQQAVETAYAEYLHSRVGASPAGAQDPSNATPAAKPKKGQAAAEEVFPRESLKAFVARAKEDLGLTERRAVDSIRTALVEAAGRAVARLAQLENEIEHAERVDPELLERDLDVIDRMLLSAAIESADEAEIQGLHKEAESELRGYRKKMDKSIYEQTVSNYVNRRLRELNGIPRLSLFYLDTNA